MEKTKNNTTKNGGNLDTSNLYYQPQEDIYNKDKLEQNIDAENINNLKLPNEEDEIKDKNLDIPGAELDDAQEEVGSEDEENNYYSIGGDGHNSMKENKE